jgi:hypothetical protein
LFVLKKFIGKRRVNDRVESADFQPKQKQTGIYRWIEQNQNKINKVIFKEEEIKTERNESERGKQMRKSFFFIFLRTEKKNSFKSEGSK